IGAGVSVGATENDVFYLEDRELSRFGFLHRALVVLFEVLREREFPDIVQQTGCERVAGQLGFATERLADFARDIRNLLAVFPDAIDGKIEWLDLIEAGK